MAQAAKKIQPGELAQAPEPVAERESPKVTRVYPTAKPKAAKPKATKPKAPIARVPAADVVALIKELGITNTQFGQAIGVGPSMVSEFVGKGRGNLMARSRWPEAQKKARAFAKAALR